jgi:hypothetical protein
MTSVVATSTVTARAALRSWLRRRRRFVVCLSVRGLVCFDVPVIWRRRRVVPEQPPMPVNVVSVRLV